MRYSTTALLSALVLSLTVNVSRADEPNSAPPAAAPGAAEHMDHDHSHEKHTELGEKMEVIGKGFKKLRKQVADSTQNASSLEIVATMKPAAEAALKLKPEKTESVPEADRAKFLADYQDGIKKLIGQLDALSAALTANDNALAEKTLKDMGAFQRDAHKEFRKPRD